MMVNFYQQQSMFINMPIFVSVHKTHDKKNLDKNNISIKKFLSVCFENNEFHK